MNKVLIVSKTHMGKHVCVGAYCRDSNQHLRLFRPDGHKLTSVEGYEVGQVWAMEFYRAHRIEPPHVEDVCVKRRQLERTLTPRDTRDAILRHIAPATGPLRALFEGALHFPPGADRSAYLTRQHIPGHSTAFWMSGRPLALFGGADGKAYYRCEEEQQSVKIPYVGFQKPQLCLPEGTLLRMSLARWESFGGETEERCYLQLSGWWM